MAHHYQDLLMNIFLEIYIKLPANYQIFNSNFFANNNIFFHFGSLHGAGNTILWGLLHGLIVIFNQFNKNSK